MVRGRPDHGAGWRRDGRMRRPDGKACGPAAVAWTATGSRTGRQPEVTLPAFAAEPAHRMRFGPGPEGCPAGAWPGVPDPQRALRRRHAHRVGWLARRAHVPIVGARMRRARSSAGEHYVDIVGVAGSIPAAPTTHIVGIGITWPYGHVMRGQRYWPRYQVSFRGPRCLSSRTRLGRRFRSEFTLTPSDLPPLNWSTMKVSERRTWSRGVRLRLRR